MNTLKESNFRSVEEKHFRWLGLFGLVMVVLGCGLFWSLRNHIVNDDEFKTSDQVEKIGGFSEIVGEVKHLVNSPTPSPKVSLKPITESKNLDQGVQVFQTFNNCGPAALSMALSHYGLSQSQLGLGQSLRPYQVANGDNDDKSVTLVELAEKAKELGFVTYHRPSGDVEMIKKFISYDMPVVTRTWLKAGEDIGHYRVVTGYDESKGVLIQDDSLQGADLEYSYQSFLDLWSAFSYEFLVLVPEERVDVAEAIMGQLVDEDSAWELALERVNAEIESQSEDVNLRFSRLVVMYHLGRYDEVTDEFEKIEAKLPSRMLWYQIEPILAYYKLGEFDRVMELSDKILNNQNRAFSELYWLRSEIYKKRGELALAEAELDKATFYNATEYWKANLE